jgi:hypothetical protein
VENGNHLDPIRQDLIINMIGKPLDPYPPDVPIDPCGDIRQASNDIQGSLDLFHERLAQFGPMFIPERGFFKLPFGFRGKETNGFISGAARATAP